nr:MAG TPA: hypothetical protein [Caudoviricetes sp.]
MHALPPLRPSVNFIIWDTPKPCVFDKPRL